MPYTRNWESPRPGCLILLLDQSGSMDDKFGGTQVGAGLKKSEVLALVLNNLLAEFVRANVSGGTIKPRADVAVLGYSGSDVRPALPPPLDAQTFVSLKDLMDNPLRIDAKVKKELDDTGAIIEIPVQVPVWVEPVAADGTPMRAAFQKAQAIASQWTSGHPDNYPPVIINITDGMATDVDLSDAQRATLDLTQATQQLRQVRTSDGEALLFNCHITEKSDPEVAFVSSETEVPNDFFARLLFSISSEIPDSARQNIQQVSQQALPAGARGFIFNGDAASIRQMFTFATVGAQLNVNPQL